MILSDDLRAALIAQYAAEMGNVGAYDYLDMLADADAYDGSAALFAKSADEERGHARMVKEHLKLYGVRPGQLPPVPPAPPYAFTRLADYYTTALALERANTRRLTSVKDIAWNDRDVDSLNLLAAMLAEQARSERQLETYAAQLAVMDEGQARDWDGDLTEILAAAAAAAD
jgi:ferritin